MKTKKQKMRWVTIPEDLSDAIKKADSKFPPEIKTRQARVSWACRQYLQTLCNLCKESAGSDN